MRASRESGGNALLQCSQVGRSSSMEGPRLPRNETDAFYVFETHGSMPGRSHFGVQRLRGDERITEEEYPALLGLPDLRLFERQDQTESCTYADSALDVDVAFMGIDHIFNDLGPESCSAGFSADGTSGEEAVANFWRHATPCIGHGNVEHMSRLRDLSENRDRAAGWDLRYGIVDQVVEAVIQPLLVCF